MANKVTNRYNEGDKVFLLNKNTNKIDSKEVEGVRIDCVFGRIGIYYLLLKDQAVRDYLQIEAPLESDMRNYFWISEQNLHPSKESLLNNL